MDLQRLYPDSCAALQYVLYALPLLVLHFTDSHQALEQVVKLCNVATLPQNGQKDTFVKRSSGRVSRKEQPLFDINPRTAQEYLARAQSEKGEVGVGVQLAGEDFTQWKDEEEEEIAKVESPLTAPTSFADALLRKLNIKDNGGQASKGGIAIQADFRPHSDLSGSSVQTSSGCPLG